MSSVRDLIVAVGERMQIDFERISRQMPHMGERGRAREDVLRAFLEAYLPGRVGVSSGIIIDHTGATSPQCDVVLYDAHCTPVFHISESTRLFPAETVFQTIEVKSHLGKRELEDALAKVRSVARLAKCSDQPQPLLAGFALSSIFGKGLTTSYKPVVVGSAIFSYTSPSLESLATSMLDRLVAQPRHEWPMYVVSLEKGAIMYGSDKPDGTIGLAPRPEGQEKLVLIHARDDHPLLVLYLLTVMHGEGVLNARPNLISYLGLSGKHQWIGLPTASSNAEEAGKGY